MELIRPISTSNFKRMMEIVDETLWYVVADEKILQETTITVSDLALHSRLDAAEKEAKNHSGFVCCIECSDLDTRGIGSAVEGVSNWQESSIVAGVASYSGKIDIASLRPSLWPSTQVDIDEPLDEAARPHVTASSQRLRRIVTDALNKSRAFKKLRSHVVVKGKSMTVKLGNKTHTFDVVRDDAGHVKEVRPHVGHGVRMRGIKKKVEGAFRDAAFEQVIEDASSGKNPRLIMLDYIRLNGGRRTRLVEAYSYRHRPSTGRTYLYGWNVEEGGIRSYITERIQHARITDKQFHPRFMVEIGENDTQKRSIKIDPSLAPTVSDAIVRRAHQRYELPGGHGKIIKRLGHSVAKEKQ